MSDIKLVYDAYGRPKPVKTEELFEYGLGEDAQPLGADIKYISFTLTDEMLHTDDVFEIIPAPAENQFIDVHKITLVYPGDSLSAGAVILRSNDLGNCWMDVDISGYVNPCIQLHYPMSYNDLFTTGTPLTAQVSTTVVGTTTGVKLYIMYSIVSI